MDETFVQCKVGQVTHKAFFISKKQSNLATSNALDNTPLTKAVYLKIFYSNLAQYTRQLEFLGFLVTVERSIRNPKGLLPEYSENARTLSCNRFGPFG